MISTSSDVASLARELWWWEHAEYVVAALVTIACFGEYLSEFSKRQWIIAHKDPIAKRSTLLLVGALSLELICLVQTNDISGRVIGSLRDKAEEADSLAQKAIQDSGTAIMQSGQAKGEAGNAKSLATEAKSGAAEASNKVQAVERRIAKLSQEAEAISVKASQARAWVLRTRPRYTFFDSNKFVEELNGVPPEKVEILYERENEEAYTLALKIANSLGHGKGNAGWDVSGPRPVTEEDAVNDNPFVRYGRPPENVPLIVRAGGSGGVGIIAKSIPPNPGKGAIGASALDNALANSGAFTTLQTYEEPNMPDGLIRIVIGEQ